MRTLINNSATGFMIGGTLVIIVAGVLNMNNEVIAGVALLFASGIIKTLTT